MNLKFIQDLNESAMYRSKQAISRVSARQVADHTFMDLIALWILYNEFEFAPNAISIAGKTIRSSSFKIYRQASTDLYLNLHILTQKRQDLLGDTADEILLDRITLSEMELKRYLNRIVTNSMDQSRARMLLQKFERDLHIETSNYRSVRRMAQEWPRLTTDQKRVTLTRMLMFYKTHARRSEMFNLLTELARAKNLEIKNAKNPETNILARAAAAGAGAVAGYHVGRRIGRALL